MKWKTKFVNVMGNEKYPIYLVKKNGKYDLECEHEIYAMAWYTIYEESIKEYEKEMIERE